MTERIEVKTKAEAEAAIKAGKAINIITGAFSLVLQDVSISIWVSNDSAPRIVTRGTSSPRIVARGTSSPSIVAWGTSSPRIEARETSSPRIEAWETSSPRIEAWGTSSPSIVANGYSSVYARGGQIKGTATANVLIRIQGSAQIEGGQQFIIKLEGAQDWCDFYGVKVEDGQARVYKGVKTGYQSYHGGDYTPGTTPRDPRWDGKKRECSAGGGLNFSPTPRHTHEFESQPAHYLECWVRLEDMVCHFDGQWPQKITAPEVCRPLIECDVDGNHIAVPAEAA